MSIYAASAQVKNILGTTVFFPSFVHTILYTSNDYQSKLKDILLKDLIYRLIFRTRKIVTIYSVDKNDVDIPQSKTFGKKLLYIYVAVYVYL